MNDNNKENDNNLITNKINDKEKNNDLINSSFEAFV
jgi:hypothetical protein